ncbi:hypothetical protein JCM3775_006303 [Rhodotorula graminis]
MSGTAPHSNGSPGLAPPLHLVDGTSRPSPPAPRPPTRTDQRERRDSSWREDQAQLQHQLRLAKAEIANLQAKLGVHASHAPFNSTSPRQSPSLGGPARKPSFTDLSASTSSLTARRRSSSNASATSPRSAHFPHHPGAATSPSPRSPSRLPEGTGPVAMNCALLSSEGSPGAGSGRAANGRSKAHSDEADALAVPPAPAPQRLPSPSALLSNGLPSASASASRSSGPSSNPFFGSGRASSERLSKSAASSQSGSGRVISGLQSDLLQARTALESTRGQLRLSQRAVEFLGRQNEDLKETKDRLSSEIDGLNRQLARKERLQDEALTRARTAEGALQVLQKQHSELERGVKGRMKELEEGAKKAEDAKVRSEREYAGLRDGLRTMQEGWKDDLRWIREDLARSQKELEVKSSTIATLLASRASLADTATSSLSSLRSDQASFAEQHSASTSSALKQLTLLATKGEADSRRADELRAEFGRLKRAMAEHAQEGERSWEGPERSWEGPERSEGSEERTAGQVEAAAG